MKYEDFEFDKALEEYEDNNAIDFTNFDNPLHPVLVSNLNDIRAHIRDGSESSCNYVINAICIMLGCIIGKVDSDKEPKFVYDKICRRIRFYETLNREG